MKEGEIRWRESNLGCKSADTAYSSNESLWYANEDKKRTEGARNTRVLNKYKNSEQKLKYIHSKKKSIVSY